MNARLLVVDDETVFAEVLSERLSMRGYTSRYCLSGRQALQIIQKEPIDVVILDMVMPRMDGLATLRAIKQTAPLVEVLLLSGKATLQTAIEGMRQGAFEYLTKPCDTHTMTAKIDAAFQRKCAQQERIDKAMAEIASAAQSPAG